MADILHGNASANQLNATTDRTQVYGLAGNDTLTSDGKSNVLLVGGSGNDSLIMLSGNGTLSGGAGADTFELNYSATQTLSAVIEDLEPSSDKIVVNFDGTATPTLNSVASGSDVVLSDSDGRLAVTLKGVRENDYFDGIASDEAWEVLKLTNDEREAQGLSQLTASEGLTAGASVRVNEIFNNGSGSSYISHTRPNGSEWYTALTKNYSASGENLDAGGNLSLPSAAVAAWIGSASHYANIVNPSYQKLGVGYIYEDSSDYEHYWVQLFGSTLTAPEIVSTSNLLTTPVEVNTVGTDLWVITLTEGDDTYYHGGVGFEGAIIATLGGNDSIRNANARVSISGGTGNDKIINASGTTIVTINGSFATINGDDGNDSINNWCENVNISGGIGNDSIYSQGSNVKIHGGTGDDTIDNRSGASVSIDGGAGDDSISSHYDSGTIYGGDGNDSIRNLGDSVTIDGGAGNDTLSNSGARVSISGGAGNDSIGWFEWSENILIQYSSGEGNDTIWGNDTNTTLRIMSDNARPTNTGDDIVYYIGEGSIRLIGARIQPPHVVLNASGTSGGGSGSSGGSGGSSSSGSGGSGSSGSGSSGSSGGSGGSSGSSSGGSGSSGTSGTSSSRPPVNTSSSRTSSGTSSSVGYVSTNRKDSIASAATRRLYNEMTATNQPTQQTTAATTQNVYTGGNQVISNYQSGDRIIFGTDYTGAFYDAAGNFFAGSSTGALAIENAMDKVIDLRDAAGNDFVKAYAATTAGVIDGRGIAGFELINGSAGADAIYAGDGGSQLWGGADVATDILVGGGGADIFIGGRTQGADLIVNASSADTVHLNDASLSDIIATEENNGVVAVAFNTGNVVAVQSSELLSAKFLLADGSSYRYNHAAKSWQSA